MIHQVITRVSLDSFRERSAGKKVVLLYPWTNYRNLFLSHFLSQAGEGLLYFRIPEDNMALTGWLGAMAQEFDTVLEGFGANLRGALDQNAAPQALGEALAADLVALNGGNGVILFIDELDRGVPGEDFDAFVHALVGSLADGAQIAFSSRLFNQHPWHDMLAREEAVVLGAEYRRSDVMFTVEEEPRPQVEIYALGRGHAIVNGQEISNWDGALPRNLFFYFVDNPLVTRDDIFETFWPNLSVKEATNVFHVTKRKISERISMKVTDGGNYELTQYTNGFYMPSDKVVRHYDAGDFQSAVDFASNTLDMRAAEKSYRHAVDLYKASFLETIDMPWVHERREQLRQFYARALIGMGGIHKDRAENEDALGFYVRALKEVPEREDIHREVIKLYLAMSMVEDAHRQYKYMEDLLNKQFKIKPSPETRALLEQIEAGV